MARITQSNFIMRKQKKEHELGILESQTPSSRVGSLQEYLVYARWCCINLERLTQFYHIPKFRRLRFDGYGAKKQAKEKLADKFIKQCTGEEKKADDLVVVLGNAKFRHNSKGHASASTSWLRRLLIRRGVLVTPDLDEWYTSQICANEDCHYKIGKKTMGCSFRIKSCPSCGLIWNRDLMAALNIRSCFIELVESGERPIYLRRPGHEED
jgi:transposase